MDTDIGDTVIHQNQQPGRAKRMDEINKIRKVFFSEGESINKIATQFNRSWATIKSLTSIPRDQLKSRGKRPNRKKTVTSEEVVKAIEGILL